MATAQNQPTPTLPKRRLGKSLEIALTPEALASIDEAAPRGAASGARYPEEALCRVNL